MSDGVAATDEARTPLFLLTGFLGSGKTTLLSRLIRSDAFADTAVIVNEFGEVGLDHHLVTKGEEEDVVLLDNGCLCCALTSSLAETLTDLYHRRARGDVPPFGRVVVETTGVADPAPLMHTVMTDRFLAARFGLEAVVACIDAQLFDSQQSRFDEVRKQAALADRLIVTKTDQVDPAARDAVAANLQALNPGAELLFSARADVDPDRVLAPAPARAGPPDLLEAGTAHGRHPSGHAHRHSDITTIFLPLDQALDWPAYAALVRWMQTDFDDRLLRAKGLIRMAGEAAPMVVQGVQHVFSPPEPLAAPLGDGERLGIVLIGRGLEEDAARDAMARMLEAARHADA
ncbi:MAG: GTP-binding protein [Alphaproteobacteria bacterium]|nr:GTP-binding protein [Alphaproteobacteria bacterium]